MAVFVRHHRLSLVAGPHFAAADDQRDVEALIGDLRELAFQLRAPRVPGA